MAYQHYIETVKEMEPRAGNKFFTTYYNASKLENEKLQEITQSFVDGMINDLEQDPISAGALYGKEIGGNHIKTNKEPYTLAEVLQDLHEQLKQGRNVTKSMIDRWNSAMNGLGLFNDAIDIEFGIRPAPGRLPNHLFEINDEN